MTGVLARHRSVKSGNERLITAVAMAPASWNEKKSANMRKGSSARLTTQMGPIESSEVNHAFRALWVGERRQPFNRGRAVG